MIKIDALMERLLAQATDDGVPCLVGTITADGAPQISPKGSVAVISGDTLCYWERSFRTSFDAISANPRIVVYYRNAARMNEMPYRGGALRFHGEARIVAEGADRDRAWELMCDQEKQRDLDKKGVAVLVRIDRIEELSGNVLMQRDE